MIAGRPSVRTDGDASSGAQLRLHVAAAAGAQPASASAAATAAAAAAVRCRPAADLRELRPRRDIGDGGGGGFASVDERRVAAGRPDVVQGRNGSAVGVQRLPATAAAHD